MSLIYSQKSVLDLSGLGEQQFRNWKKIVFKGLPVANANKFALSEFIAIYLLAHLARRVGIQVGHLARYAPSLFELCALNTLDDLAGGTLVIGIDDGIAALCAIGVRQGDRSGIFILINDVVSDLRRSLLEAEAQLSLPLTNAQE